MKQLQINNETEVDALAWNIKMKKYGDIANVKNSISKCCEMGLFFVLEPYLFQLNEYDAVEFLPTLRTNGLCQEMINNHIQMCECKILEWEYLNNKK